MIVKIHCNDANDIHARRFRTKFRERMDLDVRINANLLKIVPNVTQWFEDKTDYFRNMDDIFNSLNDKIWNYIDEIKILVDEFWTEEFENALGGFHK